MTERERGGGRREKKGGREKIKEEKLEREKEGGYEE